MAERRVTEIDVELAGWTATSSGKRTSRPPWRDFDPVWASLPPRDQIRVVELLVDRVITMARRPHLDHVPSKRDRTLADELARRKEDAA